MPAKSFAVLLSAWLCISLSVFFQTAQADITEILPRMKTSIVGIGTLHPLRSPRIKLMGTGFVVADGQHVISNAHVAPESMEEEKGESMAIFLRTDNGISVRKATIVETDKAHDLLLLKIEGSALPALTLADSDQAVEGQIYYFTGFPIGAVLGLYPATHRAGLAAIAPIFSPPAAARGLTAKLIKRADDPFLMFQLDATAYPGNSGSPLYDGNTGLVIGVVNSVFVKGAKENALSNPSGITYAIPAKYVQALLDKTGFQSPPTRGIK